MTFKKTRMCSLFNMPLKCRAMVLCTAAALLASPASRAAGSSASEESRLNEQSMDQFRVRPNADYAVAPQYRRLVSVSHPASAPTTSEPSETPLVAGQTFGAPASSQALRAAAELAQQPYFREIQLAASAASLDPALVHAVVHVESGYRCRAVSPKGALGLMQVMPDTGARYGITNLRTIKTNLKAGTLYLRDLMQLFNNRLELVLAAYNAGEGAVMKYANRIPPYPETQGYVKAVMAKYDEWRGAVVRAVPQAPAALWAPSPKDIRAC